MIAFFRYCEHSVDNAAYTMNEMKLWEVTMNLKNDDVLMCLRAFGFSCEEKTQEGFVRYQKRIGDLLVTIANGQFENKIRVSMLQDGDGKIRTTHRDILAYTDMIGEMMVAGILSEDVCTPAYDQDQDETTEEEFDELDNPLLGLPRKPAGFMAQ